jgi:hypothetical protein
MVKLEGKKLTLSEEEYVLVKKFEELELIPNQEGIFLLIDKKKAAEREGAQVCVNVPLLEQHEEVIGMIKKARLSDLVEGKFENQLNAKQKQAMLELIASGRVFVFKLNDSYKKGVYRVKDEEEKNKKRTKRDSEDFNAPKKLPPDYILETDGFVATMNNERAKILSSEYRERIEAGELKGIKSFEGIYYLIETDLLDNYTKKVLGEFLEHNEMTQEEIAEKVNISIELAKIICEFLKEDGELLEKRKGKYKYIS